MCAVRAIVAASFDAALRTLRRHGVTGFRLCLKASRLSTDNVEVLSRVSRSRVAQRTHARVRASSARRERAWAAGRRCRSQRLRCVGRGARDVAPTCDTREQAAASAENAAQAARMSDGVAKKKRKASYQKHAARSALRKRLSHKK